MALIALAPFGLRVLAAQHDDASGGEVDPDGGGKLFPIVSCRDQQRSAAFLTAILGLPPPARFAHFLVVEADNGVSLDFAETTEKITPSTTPSSWARRGSMPPLPGSAAKT